MFWRKRKPQIDMRNLDSVNHLAAQLGVERRYAIRVRYPQVASPLLPSIFFASRPLRVHDISAGGCCVFDPTEILGPSVGNDVYLILRWQDGSVSVHGRIVSRVDDKRHIQFLNLPKARAEGLKPAIALGTKAQSVRVTLDTVEQGPALQAREIWSSVHGESVVIEDHVHRLAQISVGDAQYTLYKQAWPVKAVATPLTREEMACLTVFLCNIPQPTELLSALIAHVETMVPYDESKGGS